MYADRNEAAKVLEERLRTYAADGQALIAGVPTGGAVVAATVALDLGLSFGCAGVYKVPMATQPNTTLAVIDADGHVTYDPRTELTRYEVQKAGASTLARLHRDLEKCRSGATEPDFTGATVIVIDDAAFSELVTRAAADYLKGRGAERLILATPVIAASVNAVARSHYNEVIALNVVPDTDDMARFYADYRPPDEDEMQTTVHAAYARQVSG